jgi:hypothetical protein
MADAIFDRFRSAAVVGPRGGGKTRNLSILDHLNSRFRERCGTNHVGSILAQAQLGYGYLLEYFQMKPFRRDPLTLPTMRKTTYRNGSFVAILPGTITGVSGPHPQRGLLDEADFCPWDVYQQFLGMPLSSDEVPLQEIITSALRTVHGTMQRIINEAPARGRRVYRWCVYEAMRPCPMCEDAERVKRGIVLEPPSCPLWREPSECGGRVRNSRGHLRLEDILHRHQEVDEETWIVQYLVRRGSRQGLVVPNWSVLPDGNVTEEAEYDAEAGPTFWCWDYGFTDPFVLYWCQFCKNGDVHVFDGVYVTQHDIDEVLDYVHDGSLEKEERFFCRDPRSGERRGPYRKPRVSYGDPSSPETAYRIRKRCRVRDLSKPVRILDRVSVYRRFVRDNSGYRRFKVHPRVPGLAEEMEVWHRVQLPDGTYGEQPAENVAGSNPDHGCDAVSYGCVGVDKGFPAEAEFRVLGGKR